MDCTQFKIIYIDCNRLLQAIVHSIWRERNSRRHEEVPKSIIILPTHNGLLNYIIIVFNEIIWVRDLAKQLDFFSPPLQVSYFRVLKNFKHFFIKIKKKLLHKT